MPFVHFAKSNLKEWRPRIIARRRWKIYPLHHRREEQEQGRGEKQDLIGIGLADIYFAGNLVQSRLYLNKGELKFEDITKNAGVAAKETWNNGATMADVNGDGYLDIYVCSSTDGRPKYRKNLLFINSKTTVSIV